MLRVAATRGRARRGFSLSFAALSPGAHASIPGVSVTRASSATVQTGTSTLAHAVADEARVGRSSDADAPGLLVEGSRTNYVTKSRNVAGMTASGETHYADHGAGPDGSALADRATIGANGYSNVENVNVGNGTKAVASCFYKAVSGTQHAQLVCWDGSLSAHPSVYANSDTGALWQRLVTPPHAQAVNPSTVIPCDCRDHSPHPGGTNPGATDLLVDLVQCERGEYATSPIVTAGATVTRSADLVTLADASRFVSGGKLKISLTFRPLCSLAQLAYDTALPVLLFRSADLECAAWINPATRCLSVYAGGRSTAYTLPTWAAGDRVELALQAGAGAAITRIRINGGTVTDLVGSGFDGSAASASGTASLLSLAGTHPLPCWLESVSGTLALPAGSAGSAPSGAVAVVCEGNSITYGYGTTTPYPARLQTALGAGYVVTNLGVSGSVIEPAADDLGYPAMSARTLQAGAYAAQRSIVVSWEFTNTLAALAVAGYSAADAASTALTRWRRLVRLYRSMGFRVLTLSMLPRTDSYITAPQSAVVEAARQLVNPVLLADSTCGDYALDIAANVNLATVNGTYYNGDNVHLTDAGNQVVADAVSAKIQAIFS